MSSPPQSVTSDVTLERLEDQINWYDRKSSNNRSWHIRFKIATLVAAATIPVASAAGTPALVPGGLGALVVVFEGLQQLFQFHNNWVTYRSTCEMLKHEKYFYLAQAGPYADAAQPRRMLAERVESLVSTETGKWMSSQEQSQKKDDRP